MTDAKRQAVEKLRASGHYQKAGAKGGNMTKKRKLADDPEYYSRIGRISGLALLESRGVEFYSAIGSLPKKSRKEAM